MGNLGCCDGSYGDGIQIMFHKKIFEIKADINNSVKQIKEKISVKNQVSIRIILLTYNGTVLQDNQTLLEIGFSIKQDQLILSLLQDLSSSFSMTIRNINFTDTIQVKSTDKVKQIKNRIDRKYSVDPPLQRLIFNGQVLQNDQQIGKYGVYQGCTIHLAIKLK